LNPLPFLEECQRHHGSPCTIRLVRDTFVLLTAPDAIKDVFRGDPHVLHSGEGNALFKASVGPSSVLVLDDEPHARQRRILVPPLKGERMRAFFDAMREATLDVARRWPVGRVCRADEAMRYISLRVILRAALGLPPGSRLEAFEGMVNRLLAPTRGRFNLFWMILLPVHLLVGSRWAPFFRQVRELDRALFAFFEEQRRLPAAKRGETVVADLLAAVYDDGKPPADTELRDAVLTILIAGHETTALALSWALECIVARPDVMGHIAEELRTVTDGGPLRPEHLPRLEYLDAAIRESLRCRTILPFVVRKTKAPFVAGGREYPPGVLLSPCNHLVHRDPGLYPEPRRFRPERFLERRFAAHEWFPFGGGNRVCLGMPFALYEMKVVLATLFLSVRLERPPGALSYPVRSGITLAPNDGVRLMVAAHAEGSHWT
jgi:cytochrome P450